MELELLDCTIRDGGYYTNWDFDPDMVDIYLKSMNELPIEYLEIGYRSKPLSGYHGEFFYCPNYLINEIKSKTDKKLVIILNEKDVLAQDAEEILLGCVNKIDLVRIAIDPKNFLRSIELAKVIKQLGFKVGFNVMYMSTWKENKEFLSQLELTNGVIDYFYMVDSFGGVFPEDVKELFDIVKDKVSAKVGFHGHNNLELALINTLTAIQCGVDIVDATITGMGRGAGNLKTELLLTTLNSKSELNLNFNALGKVVDIFTQLQNEHKWGTNLGYMVSGAHSIPQKEVMEWFANRFYSFNSIIRALSNRSKGILDNVKLKKLDFNTQNKFDKAIIIGGGPSVKMHAKGLYQFILSQPDIVIIHASSKNGKYFQSLPNQQYFCLVGNEGHRLEEVFSFDKKFNGKCILPPYPRVMGTYIPMHLNESAFELSDVNFTDKYQDSHTALALETARELGCTQVFIAGYDGYSGLSMGKKEKGLFKENEYLFTQLKNNGISLVSVTETQYEGMTQTSLYKFLNV
ncbi:MAG: aldolase catalytic domain-containing protein [Salibacteraceae bacterium]